jgi:hypothetical protein
MRDDRPKGAVVARPRALYGYEGRARLWGSPYEGRVPIVTSVVFVLPFLT